MIRIALVGLGAASRTIHLPALRRIPRLVLVGGVDPDPRDCAGLARFPDVATLLREARPDIVVVATPPATHFPLARQLLESGCHVFLEKPLSSTLEEGAALVRAARDSGRHLVVNNEFRYMNCHAAARAQIGREGFGELRFVHMHQTFRVSAASETGWRGVAPERTCAEFGIHALDLCRYFFAADPSALQARMGSATGSAGPDMLNLIDVAFPDGRMARITLDRLTRGRHRYLDCTLDGTQGTVETELGGAVELHLGVRAGTRRPYVEFDVSAGGRAFLFAGERRRKIAADPLDLFAAATRVLMNAFLDALESGREPPCSAADNFRSFALMRAAYDSAREGREITMGERYDAAQ